MTPDGRLDVWSCGGGRQSAAIAALICSGRLRKPDIAVMVDTGREKSSTWLYVKHVIAPNLAAVGVDLQIVKKDDYCDSDLFHENEEGKQTLLLPMFTTESGKAGKWTNWCSGYWKRDTLSRYLRAQGVKKCRSWIGISTNEMRRVTVSRTQWNQNCYVLLEAEFGLYMSCHDCVHYVTDVMGWPRPLGSACWMCPNLSDDEWREMKQFYPADFVKACDLDDAIRRDHDANFFVHGSCIPLRDVDFDKPEVANLFGAKMGGCSSGYCFV